MQKDECQKRMLGAKKVILTPEEKQEIVNRFQLERDEWELQNLGNFFGIMDEDSMTDLKSMLEYSNYLYTESTGASNFNLKDVRRNQKKEMNTPQTQYNKHHVNPEKQNDKT